MRFEVKAKAETRLRIPGPVQHDHGAFRVHLIPDEEGIVCEVATSTEVPEFEQFLPTLTTVPGGPHQLEFPGGPFIDELMELLQYLESMGSFWLEFRKINWEDPQMRWVPESPQEESKLGVFSITQTYAFSDEPRDFNPHLLEAALMNRKERAFLVIPMAFYREGIIEHSRLRFIQAFFNFYFFLEGLFGGGKTKNYQVENEFLKSQSLRDATEKALRDMRERCVTCFL